MSNFGFYYVVGTTETVVDSSITTLDVALKWVVANADTDTHTSYAIQLDGNEVVEAWKTLQCTNKAITLQIRRYQAATLGAVTITFTPSNPVPDRKPDGILVVGQGLSLILENKITVSGANCPTLKEYGGFILVQEGGTLRMRTGSKIIGVAVRHNSGAVTVNLTDASIASFFFMEGGEISGNLTSGDTEINPGDSPAVLLGRQGQFTMGGGSITNNTRGVAISGSDACFTMNGGTITNNGTTYEKRLRGAGVCVGVNLSGGSFVFNGGTISGNGVPGVGTDLPPGGGVYVSAKNAYLTLAGAVTIDQGTNTVCLTSASSGQCPLITLGQGFTVNNPLIKLDLAATRPEWVPSWEGKTVLKLGAGSTSSIAALKGRFVLGKFYYSSGNKDYELADNPPLSSYHIDDNGVLVKN
jgi:hypothetical protein